MDKHDFKTLIGVQGTVIGWDDPWHYRLCGKNMRTGEGQHFPSQDKRPEPGAFIEFIKSLGADFYMHHVMPDDSEILEFIESVNELDIPFLLGNEFGNINKNDVSENNRYDIPGSCTKAALATGKFLGLIYDETEHLQLHPEIYSRNLKTPEPVEPSHQWASTKGKTLEQIENEVSNAVKKVAEQYGGNIPMYSEQVFPVMYHTLARGGMNPCPKVLKEEFQSLQLSTALGAAKQYGRKLGICVDLWGQDVGDWFTRIWGFPGHSPREFKSALEMAYRMGPDFMFVENIDSMAMNGADGLKKTEFGEIFQEFAGKFAVENPRSYDHSMVDPDIVIIRSDDSDWNMHGGVFNRGLYGSMDIKSDDKTSSVFKIFNLLSHDTIPTDGLTFFLPRYEYHASKYSRTKETLKTLPLINGVGIEERTCTHKLFYPMNNVAVFDERIDGKAMGNPKLIFIAGSRITDQCLEAVAERVRSGAVCIAASWLMPDDCSFNGKDGQGCWIKTDDFLDDTVKEAVEPFIGSRSVWTQRFGDYEVRFYNPNNDGITLAHEVVKIK